MKLSTRILGTIAVLLSISGCWSNNNAPALDPAKANAAAQSHVSTLFSGKDVKGPVCMPEAVVDGYTQCSFTYVETSGDTKVGTILCRNSGCMEGDAPALVSADMAPSGGFHSGGSHSDGGLTDSWLFWYLLFSNGGTSHHYHSWYDSTPAYGRTAYYSRTVVPSAKSKTYYSKTYSKPVASTATKTYSSKTSPKKTTATKTTTTKKSTTTTKPKTTTTKKSSRRSGYGSSRRSSGRRR